MLSVHLFPAYCVQIWLWSDKHFLRYLTKGKIRSLCDLVWLMTLKILKTHFWATRPYCLAGSKVWLHYSYLKCIKINRKFVKRTKIDKPTNFHMHKNFLLVRPIAKILSDFQLEGLIMSINPRTFSDHNNYLDIK